MPEEAEELPDNGITVAVPVPVAMVLFTGCEFAPDGCHPTLGAALVP
jgi:hypothetical protein